MTDVYCWVNRARGMELLSPDDLLNACKMLKNLQLPVRCEYLVNVLCIALNIPYCS